VTLSAVSLPDGPVLHDGLQLYADQGNVSVKCHSV